jgi:uncharacterized membrane protein (DUF485 family)
MASAVPAPEGSLGEATAAAVETSHTRHGEHVDTIENVNRVFVRQRRLSFSFGAVFFAVTLLIPAFTVWWPWWWDVEIWGGFTANYLVVSLVYFVFLWVMAWTYSARADKLDAQLANMEIEDWGVQQRLAVDELKAAIEEEEV